VLVLPGWPPGCFLMASRAKSQVIVPGEVWGDSELGESLWSEAASTCPHVPCWPPGMCPHRSGDSNTVAMNGRVDFPKKKLAHQ